MKAIVLGGTVWTVVVPSAAVWAEVTSAAAHGFRIEISEQVTAPPEVVYSAVINDVSRWWLASHTYSGDAGNLYLEAVEKGWFGEKLADGGFARHLEVGFLIPGKTIRLLGGLGPLQAMGVNGALTLSFARREPGASVGLVYVVSGYVPGGLDKVAPQVDSVLAAQLTSLKSYVEKSQRTEESNSRGPTE